MVGSSSWSRRKSQQRKYYFRKKNKLCTACGKVLSKNDKTVLCNTHRKKNNEGAIKYRKRFL